MGWSKETRHGQTNYDEEFKRDAVELLLSGAKGLKPLARDLGVCPATLWRWTRGTRGRGWTRTGHRQSQARNRGPRGPGPDSTAIRGSASCIPRGRGWPRSGRGWTCTGHRQSQGARSWTG
ncbi:MAG: transposase [Candidatus Hydrogenedentales bacterium]